MAKVDSETVGMKLFDAVSNGKITTSEYNAAVKGWKVIKKVCL